MPSAALFDINDDGENAGYEATNSESLELTLRDPSLASTVVFQVYSTVVDPSLGIAANPPRASSGAPILTLVGATSGQAVSPTSVSGTVTVALPASGSHSWIVRCVVNGGLRQLPNGVIVVDPSLVYERGVWIPTGFNTRKVVATESIQFSAEGWADAVNQLIENGVSPGTYSPPGVGAVVRTITSRLADDVYVTDFMTSAEIAAAYAGNWTLDHQPAIQRAIHHALYLNSTGFSSGRRVRLGGGMYRIDRPIHLGYGTDFRSIEFVGDGKREGGTYEGGGAGTVIRAFHSDAPALCIQGARSTVVRGMSFIGPNFNHVVALIQGTPSMNHVNASAWVDPALAANAGSRYAPNAAIAIDPYTGPQPTPHYPDVEYPAFLAGTPQYNKGQSRDVLIDDVNIKGFVVGVVQHPGDADGNGDYTKLSRVSFWFCAYGFSWGNTQARVNELDHCTFTYMHTCFATTIHGLQIGNPQVTLTTCAFETSIRIFETMNLGYGVGPHFIGCFGEAIYQLGKCNGVSQNAGALSFKNCEFGFSWWSTYGVPTWVLEMEGSMEVSFEQVFFYLSGAGRGFLNFRCAGSSLDAQPANQLAFTGCQTQADALVSIHEKAAYNATLGITISNASTGLARFSCRSGYIRNLDTGNLLGTGVMYTERAYAPRHIGAPVYAKKLKSLVGSHDPGVDVAWQDFGLSISSVISTVGRLVVVDLSYVTTHTLMHFGGDVGDYLVSGATGAVFVCKARTGTQLTLEAMSGFDRNGNLLASIVAEGILFPKNCRRHMLPAVLYGDITAGSPTVTNLKLGNTATPTLADILTANDYLYVDQETDQVINPFDGSARLVSFNQGASTMTFNGNFNITQARRRFSVFVRPAFPNT